MLEFKLLQLFWLLAAHFVADFALQQFWMIKRKWKDPWVLVAHCMIWTGLISLPLEAMGVLVLWKVLFLFGGHIICDSLKHLVFHKTNEHLKNAVDQSFHILQIIIVWLI